MPYGHKNKHFVNIITETLHNIEKYKKLYLNIHKRIWFLRSGYTYLFIKATMAQIHTFYKQQLWWFPPGTPFALFWHVMYTWLPYYKPYLQKKKIFTDKVWNNEEKILIFRSLRRFQKKFRSDDIITLQSMTSLGGLLEYRINSVTEYL